MSNDYQGPGATQNAAFNPNGLQAGGDPFVMSVTLVSGQNVVRGTVLGQITTGGKFAKSLTASSDGSEVADAIAFEDMDATLGDKTIQIYVKGKFKLSQLTLGAGHTLATIQRVLARKSILIENDQQY